MGYWQRAAASARKSVEHENDDPVPVVSNTYMIASFEYDVPLRRLVETWMSRCSRACIELGISPRGGRHFESSTEK